MEKDSKKEKYVSRQGVQDGEHYHEFWQRILSDYDGQLKDLALDIGWSYRRLHRICSKEMSNTHVVDCIKVARATGTDPEKFYFLLHKHFYGLQASRPIRGRSW